VCSVVVGYMLVVISANVMGVTVVCSDASGTVGLDVVVMS
jgi:hypothetical protein